MSDEIKGVYEINQMKFSDGYQKISEKPVVVKNMNYRWIVECRKSEDSENRQIVVGVKMESRYTFNDIVTLVLSVDFEEKNDSYTVIEEIDLQKSFETQYFECDCSKVVPLENWDSALFQAKVIVTPVGYYTRNCGSVCDLEDEGRPYDVIVEIEERKFFVLKNYLATWSRYFDRLFFGEFKEKNQKLVKIEEVDPDSFLKLLEFIYPDLTTRLEDSNVLELLKLADRFEMPSVMAECGTYLQNFENCPDLSLMDRLELADKHNLVHLQIACFENIHSMPPAYFKMFHDQNWPRLRQLSPNTQKNLL